MGVLFLIDTHENATEFKSICDKLYDHFKELSSTLEVNALKPIILSQCKVSKKKEVFHDVEAQGRLLKKANCLFGVFLKATETGSGSNKYELRMNAAILHPTLTPFEKKILQNNFAYVFEGLRLNTIDRSDDLKQLQSLSVQLFYVCQLIYSVANSYSKRYIAAIELLDSIYKSLELRIDKFCIPFLQIICNEIFANYLFAHQDLYDAYLDNAIYDVALAGKIQAMVRPYLKIVSDDFRTCYHLQRAIYYLLCDNLPMSNQEISSIKKTNKKVLPNQRVWDYSEAFLLACENDPQNYVRVMNRYEALKGNVNSAYRIFRFINTYYSEHEDNLGVKIALYSLAYYRSDVDLDMLPANFKDEIIAQLKELELEKAISRISLMQ